MGGSIGALARYATTSVALKLGLNDPRWATLCVNVIGCVAIGWLLEGILGDRPPQDPTKLMLVTGLLGSLTTFSTFGYETWSWLSTGKLIAAGCWILANVVLGLVGVWIGTLIGGTVPGTGTPA